MAYHGNRGAPKRRGSSFKGRGGSSSSRGRGRGGAGSKRGRGRPVFDSARVAEKEAEEFDERRAIATSEIEVENLSEDVSSDEEDDEELHVVRPYAALLQSLAVDTVPQAKRLKLENLAKQNTTVDLHEKTVLDESNDVDHVEEAEEGPELAIDELSEADEHDISDRSDPFEAHFANPDDNILSRRLNRLNAKQWLTHRSTLPIYGKAVFSIPDDNTFGEAFLPATISGYAALRLKQKLASLLTTQTSTFDPLESFIAPCIFNYHDLLFCERNLANSETLRRLVCLHAINHIFKTRDHVIKNNERLSKEDKDLDIRDQGFTRPKVLMLLPTRQSCARMVAMITSICQPDQQENKKRFEDSYVEKDENISAERPEDFQELFSGNDDDMFRLGMKFTRKTVKYFSQFYNSDIIFGSPLGLRMAIGNEEDKKVDRDFLSSIELVIVDQAESLPMQNWEHMEFIFENLNLQPKEAHGCDFGRVRSWYLDNKAKHFRQTIALSAFNTPELNTLFFNKSENWAGKIKISANYPGALQELGLKIKQTFSRLEPSSFSTDPDARFNYFLTAIIPSLTRHSKESTGTLIFIPSYLDFVRVRNYFSSSTKTSLSFGTISEYTSVPDVARARSHFLSGRHKILLYTERAHHFRRHRLRGVRKVIMYGLPDNPIFYEEIVGGYLGKSIQEGIVEPGEGSVKVIFSKWDILKLERIAGTERVGKMIREKGDTFDFV